MDEYKMIKCLACGHERRGPRIIRLSGEDKEKHKRIKALNRRLNLVEKTIFFLTVSMAIVGMCGTGIFLVKFPPLCLENQFPFYVFLAMIAAFLIILIPPLFFLKKYYTRREAAIKSQMEEIWSRYNVKEEEWCVINEKEG